MITAGRIFKGLVGCLSILALSACGDAMANRATDPIVVVFDATQDEIVESSVWLLPKITAIGFQKRYYKKEKVVWKKF